jgi:hypothetical protein
MPVTATDRRRGRAVLTACWLVSVIGTGVQGLGFDKAPGSPGRVQAEWPAVEPQPADRPTLLLFAHPKCPCTSAALDELDDTLRRCATRPRVTIYFVCPPGVPATWECGRNWDKALGVGGCRVERDADGRLARSFGVETSGHALLFTAGGSLRFSGGVRSHPPDLSGLLDSDGPPVRADVFGCPLFAPAAPSEDRP